MNLGYIYQYTKSDLSLKTLYASAGRTQQNMKQPTLHSILWFSKAPANVRKAMDYIGVRKSNNITQQQLAGYCYMFLCFLYRYATNCHSFRRQLLCRTFPRVTYIV